MQGKLIRQPRQVRRGSCRLRPVPWNLFVDYECCSFIPQPTFDFTLPHGSSYPIPIARLPQSFFICSAMAAAARLTFLSPQALRAVRAGWPPRAGVAGGLARHRGTFARRRGKAVEPNPLHAAKSRVANPLPNAVAAAAPAAIGTSTMTPRQPTESPDPALLAGSANVSTAASTVPTEQSTATPTPTRKNAPKPDAEQIADEERARPARDEVKTSGPLEAVLHMQPPEGTEKQGPALAPPPYVHHFDTYTLVKELIKGGYTQEQATTSMKAIRTSLAQNLDVAQSTLVSKSDVENVRPDAGLGHTW